jgi:hypothetical protein
MLIPIYGILGAAIASLISKIIFSFVKWYFLYNKFGLQPFTIKYVYLIIVGLATYYISIQMPAFSNFIVDLVIRSLLISILFIVPVYFLKVSEDLNQRMEAVLRRLMGTNNR